MGSRRGLEDGVPVALVILAFLSTPAAPEDAPDPNLAAAFLFFSKIIFALLTASVGAGPGFSSAWGTVAAVIPGFPSPEAAAAAVATGVPLERGGEALGTGGLGERLDVVGCGSSFWLFDAAGDAAVAVVVLLLLLHRRKTLRRYSSSGVSTSAARSSAACVRYDVAAQGRSLVFTVQPKRGAMPSGYCLVYSINGGCHPRIPSLTYRLLEQEIGQFLNGYSSM